MEQDYNPQALEKAVQKLLEAQATLAKWKNIPAEAKKEYYLRVALIKVPRVRSRVRGYRPAVNSPK